MKNKHKTYIIADHNMERLPFHEATNLPKWVMFYAANSIADIQNPDSRIQVISDIKENIHNMPRHLQIMARINELIDRPYYWLTRREYHPNGMLFILVPYIRHDPQRDDEIKSGINDVLSTTDKLLVYDQTGDLEVQLPEFPLSTLLKMAGIYLPDIIKKVTWCSHALLMASYTPHEDSFTLLHLFNEAIKDPARESLPLLAKLAPMLGRSY